jgi:DinB family protein
MNDTLPCLDLLEATPAIVRGLMSEISEEDARWKPAAHRFSIAEVLSHLSHSEGHCYRPRVDRFLSEETPTFEPDDAQMHLEVYKNADPKEAFGQFEDQREANIELLRGLPTEAGNRRLPRDVRRAGRHPAGGLHGLGGRAGRARLPLDLRGPRPRRLPPQPGAGRRGAVLPGHARRPHGPLARRRGPHDLLRGLEVHAATAGLEGGRVHGPRRPGGEQRATSARRATPTRPRGPRCIARRPNTSSSEGAGRAGGHPDPGGRTPSRRTPSAVASRWTRRPTRPPGRRVNAPGW